MSLIKKAWENKKQIAEGVANVIFHKTELASVTAQRLSLCKTCSFYSVNAQSNGYKTMRPDIHCTSCGCNLELKTSCISCSCPLDPPVWTAINEHPNTNKEKTGA
jgi:hypothetical protein